MSTPSNIRSRVWRNNAVVESDIEMDDISNHLTSPEDLLWVGLQSPSQADLDKLGSELGLDPAAIEDALNHVERPKAIRYENYSFVTAYAARMDAQAPAPESGQGRESQLQLTKVSAFVFPRGIVTVWYDPQFDFSPIIDRWDEVGNLNHFGAPMLLHGMLDYIVDGYFAIAQLFDDAVEDLEDEVLDQRTSGGDLQRRIYRLRKDLVRLRRAVLPIREVVASLMRHRRETDTGHDLDPWFDDLYDHSLRAAEWTDSLRDLVTTIFETNMGLQDTRLNIVMRQLAAWAAIIAVPTAITGWFGQNVPYFGFNEPFGVWVSLGSIVLISLGLFISFKRRDWI